MSITITDVTLRNTIADAVITRLGSGTTNPTARLIFRTAANETLSTNNFSSPPAGSASSGSVTFSAIADATIADTGTVDNFIATNRDNTTIFSGNVSVTAGSGDIKFNTVSWTSGDTCSISSLTLTVPGA
jgi:hypothetical protein